MNILTSLYSYYNAIYVMQEWKFIHILYQVYLCTCACACHPAMPYHCFVLFIGFPFLPMYVDQSMFRSFFLSRETKTPENEEKEIKITYIGSSSPRLTIAEYTSNELLRTRPITLNVKHSRNFNGFAWQPIKCGIIGYNISSFSFCLRTMSMRNESVAYTQKQCS